MEIALWIDTPALGDTIAAIPTLRKISEAYGNQPITVFTTKPFLFENHPLVKQAFKSDADKSNYMVYRTFSPLVGKQYDQHGTKIEFRYSNMDFRQFHAVSLGFTLQQHEMEMDLYIERERELPVKDYVIIHPTHTWPTRTWDREKWQALVDELNSRGIPVVAVGRDSREVGFYNTEKPVMDIDIKLGVNLLNDPDNDPAELRWMMNHRARAVVTMDSGMLHIAGTTDVNIIQLGSSIDNKLRAPYRGPNISQDYKYAYANGGCEVFCSSNMKSNVQVHGSIQGVPPQVKCLENRPTFECHPTVDQALQELLKLIDYKPNQSIDITEQIEDMQEYVNKINNLNITPKTILEIGSRDGHHAEALRRAFNIDSTGVYAVDANPNQHQKIVSAYPNINFIGKAISDKKGTVDFYQINSGDDGWDGISGLLDRPELYSKQFTNTKKIEVESITGKELLDSIGKEIDICKIDVEGLTYEVLQSFGEDLNKVKTLHIETEQREVWEGQKLDSDVKQLLESKGFVKLYNKTHNTKWGEQYDQVWAQSSLIKMHKAYVMHCDENYLPIVENSIKTVREFSQLPIIVYVINSDAKVNVPGVITHRLDFDIRQGDTFIKTAEGENKFIQRNSQAVYDIITKKADACKHALENYANTIVYLDGDIVATHKIDELFDYPVNLVDYPLCTTSSYTYMMMNGKGSPFPEEEGEVFDLNKTLEKDVCDLLEINIWNRNYPLNYVQTGFILAGQNSLPFIQEWIDLCNLPEIANNHNQYAPYHEETLFNVLRWKYNYREQLPFVYVNANSVETVKNIFYNTKYDGRNYVIQPNFGSRTGRFNDIKAFHGEKRPEVIKEMVNEIKRFQAIEENTSGKKRLVFLAPHLSTGGMPEFLLHRIKALQDQDEFEIHVIEYNMYAHTFVVQRTQIESLVEGRFYSLGDLGVEQELRETRLLRLLETINPDVIHIEECPEAFDSFNKMSEETQLAIYDKNQPWKIVETCHNIWFNPEEGKRFSPDAYAFVTPHHELETFAKEKSTKQQVLFPIIEQSVSDTARRKMLEVFGFPTQSNQYHLVNIGLWTPGKNQGEAIEWARALEAESPGTYQFHFVGNQASNFESYWGPLMEDLPANCHIHGERSDVDSFYQIADAIVFNSTWECNPLTVRQSLGYPLPVIARNLPQYHDMYESQLVEITGDTAEDLLRLKQALQAPKPERTNEYTMARFKKEHLNLYMQTLNGPQKRSQDKKAYTITWDAGPKVTSKVDREIEVDFQIDGWHKSVYKATLKGQGHWCKPAIQYWADWKIYIDGELIQLDHSAPQIVQFDSSSLGDTLSWVEPCVEFKNTRGMDKLYVATHKNWLFDVDHYRELGIEFIKPGEWPTDAVALWRVGVYMEDVGGQVWFPNKNPRDWRKIYLGDIASDALGIGQVMRSPKLTYSGRTQQKRPYICIATASTAQAKYWNHPTGWQDLVDHYKAKGYDVYHISKENTDLKGIKKAPEDLKDVYRLLQGAEMFFGISSGLSWFAWATDVPVVLISGFTPEICEFDDDKTLRIINKDVCNSCWFKHHFNRGDWNWCPEHKGTERQFECTKSISAESVIAQVDAWALEVEKETVNAYDHN